MTTSMDAPSISLIAGDGASARIHLDGAHVSSWVPAGGAEQLFVSERSLYGTGRAIRGGIPICWPQFGPFGPIRHHGFARLVRWVPDTQRVDADGAHASLTLSDSDETRAQWPHAFHARLAVHVAGPALQVTLTVTNTGDASFTFTGALHPYFRVRDAYTVDVAGLRGTICKDSLQDGLEFPETGASVPVRGHLDRVYFGAADVLTIREPHRSLRVEKAGFPDAVVWNPGAHGTASRADFVPGDERIMVCVEAALVRPAMVLAPGASWTGSQRFVTEP